MDTQTAAPETDVTVKVSEPEAHAPSIISEAVSGPTVEMSGALPSAQAEVTMAKAAAISTNAEALSAKDAVGPASRDPPSPAAAPASTEPPPDPVPETTTTQEDTKMNETTEATSAAAEAAPVPATNGTPAAEKSSSGKRKSVSGVPEHKGKKLNKKKSMPKITHLDAKPGDMYFARLKSYPPWPSIICDEKMLPVSLLNNRPVTTAKKDGTYNEPYADGGKKVSERTYPVMFLYTNEFAFIPNTDLTPLNPEECKDVAEKGKAKALIAAYAVAAEGHDLQYFKNMLFDHARAIREDEEAKEAKEAEKAAKAAKAMTEKGEKKKARKSDAKVESDDVEMEDADSGAEFKKSSKKRKKEADSDEEETEKTPKTTKLKLTTSKTPTTTEKRSKEKAVKPKADKKKTKAPASDEEMADAPEAEPEQPLDPVEARKAREKEVLFLRHRLQKGFLTRDQAPQEEEMPQMSNYIKKLENYGDLEVSIIRGTKINKVLKALIKLDTIPKDEEFNFKKRSLELLTKWNKILGTEPAEGEASVVEKDKSTPTTNGVHEEKTKDTKEDTAPLAEPAAPAEPAEKAAEPAVTESTELELPKQPTVGEVAPAAEPPKVEESLPEPAVLEKAPESAAAAAEATDMVKAAE